MAQMLRPPIEPMLARAVSDLPRLATSRQDLLLEPKFDGFRALAFSRPGSIFLQSRSGRPLAPYFPDITRIIRAGIPENVVLDGELIVWEPTRHRTNFTLLQRRITAGAALLRLTRQHPAHFVVFDLLQDADGRELLDEPFAQRRARLIERLADAPSALVLCPQTTSHHEAVDWTTTWTSLGIEGIVAKRSAGRYLPGTRGWLKYRARTTTEAIIGGITGTISRPESVLLGRFDSTGRIRYTGRTSTLTPVQQTELAPLLSPATRARTGEITHPWPQPLPAAWTGQLGRPQPLPYRQVTPALVAEINVDTAFERQRWRHLVRFLRARVDLSVYDVPLLLSE
jgi:ATP-dependent DNA ligase